MTVTKRSFAIVGAQKESGCPTKYNANSRFESSNPRSAAMKAFSGLCKLKRVKGKCTFVVTVIDTTRGARTKGKKYTYKVDRKKLAKPIVLQKGTNAEYKINYAVSARKSSIKLNPTKSCGKSSGPMKKTTPRKNKQEEKKKRLSKSKGVAGKGRKTKRAKSNYKSLTNRLFGR